MRQVMPHRNNIGVRRTKSKAFFSLYRENRPGGARMVLECRRGNCGICGEISRYNHTKQWFMEISESLRLHPNPPLGNITYA